jgi:RimJ/RimL family protein N-acetyltransferase
MKSVVETKRLILREMSLADLDFVGAMLAHPEVMHYWPKCYSREEAADWIKRQQKRYAADGVGYWLALDKASGRPVGQAGLLVQQVDGAEEIGLGYIIHRPFWRKGFASEAAAGSMDYALKALGRRRLVALIRPENVPSQGVALKLGMAVEKTTRHADFEHLVFVKSLSADSFASLNHVPFMRLLLVGVSLFLSIITTSAAGVVLADHGRSQYTIVTAPDASTTVKHAAQELADDLKQISGAALPVMSRKPPGPAIFVGGSPFLPSGFQNSRLDTLAEEGFVVRTDRSDVYLAGHDDRGTLYAVYSFLEDHLGVRWYAPDATVLRPQDVVRVPDLNETQAPAFGYRNTDEAMVFGQGQWDAHLKLNGINVPDQAELGGINRLFNGAENFYGLVPPNRYFASHPDYYSLVGGKRKSSPDSQLCLSSPGVFKVVVDALVAEAKANPKELTLGLSPNDARNGNCQCEACRAADAKFGSPAGTLLDFVNKVAAAVQAALPDRKIWVETLAYQYTEKAPLPGAIAPAKNVLVCLAPIYACDGHPLASDPQNKTSNEALLAWSKIAPGHLHIWHYVVNFAHYVQPYPDWDELGADMAYYRGNGVSGMYCEGDYEGNGDMQAMHTWVMAHLFWNPRQDVWALVRDFSDGYYGKAGADIYAYLRLLHDRLQQSGVHLHLYDPPTSPLFSAELLKSAGGLFDHAEAVAETPEIKSRVQEARMGIRYIELANHVPGKNATAAERDAFRVRLDSFIVDIGRFKIVSISEGQKADGWIKKMKAAASP